jgi:hypothetical protein
MLLPGGLAKLSPVVWIGMRHQLPKKEIHVRVKQQ